MVIRLGLGPVAPLGVGGWRQSFLPSTTFPGQIKKGKGKLLGALKGLSLKKKVDLGGGVQERGRASASRGVFSWPRPKQAGPLEAPESSQNSCWGRDLEGCQEMV